ncbi:EpsG family protein [Deinococcus sp. PEB2-67]
MNSNGILLLLGIIPLLTYAIYWGRRPFTTGSDTLNYVKMFSDLIKGDYSLLSTMDSGFLALIRISASISDNPSLFLTIISLIQATCFYIVGIILLKRSIYLYLYIFMLLTSPFYLSININILRHGTSISVALLCVSIIYRMKVHFYRFLLAYIPTLFHNVAGMLTIPLFIKIKKYNMIYIWFCMAFISYFSGYYSGFFSRFIKEDYIDYVSGSFDYTKGFRIDFTLFSMIPILLSAAIPFRKMSEDARWIYNSYLIMNGFGLMINFISFSDRLLISSWILIPILAALLIKDVSTHAYKITSNKIFFSSYIFIVVILINILL